MLLFFLFVVYNVWCGSIKEKVLQAEGGTTKIIYLFGLELN